MPKAVGIDFGTTSSSVAVLDAGELVVIPNAEGARATPSVVGFTKTGELLVGEAAKRQAAANPDRTVGSILRHIGTLWAIDVDGHVYTAEEISARILQKLRRDAEFHLGEVVSSAVITVPSQFGQAQRRAIRLAGQIAGLEVLRLINAPSAAALGYMPFRGVDHDLTVLMFDLGGGTFDVSILEIGEGVWEVQASSGSARLGGDDWDQRVVYWLVQQFKADHGVDLSKDKLALQRLKEAAETAKIELSALRETQITVPYIAASATGPLHLDYALNRVKFQEITAHLVKACREQCEQVLNDLQALRQPLTNGNVLVVGGSSRMPAIQELVDAFTPKQSRRGVDPDAVAALGAAMEAGVLTGEVKDVLLLDVLTRSIGVETAGGLMTRVVERDTTIRTRRMEVFNANDLPSTTEIHVVQGEHKLASANETVSRLEIASTASPAGRGGAFKVTIDVDCDGIVWATATRATPPPPDQHQERRHDQHQQSQSQATVVVDRAVGNKHLCVTTEKIVFANNVVYLDAIDGVAYRSLKTIVNGITTEMERLFTVSSHGKILTIDLNASGWKGPTAREADETTWRTLIGLSNQMIEPRLVAAMVGRLRSGMSVQIGGFTIERTGLTLSTAKGKTSSLTWDFFAGATLKRGVIVVNAKKPYESKVKTWASIQATAMNAVLLPSVLEAASTLFAT